MHKDVSKSFYNRKERFEDIVEQTMHLEKTVFKLSNKVKVNKEEISKQMGKKQSVLVSKEKDGITLRVTKETDAKIKFNHEEIKRKLNKEALNEITDKEIVIKDIKGLITLLKKHKVSQKAFKECIEVKENLNIEKLDLLVGAEEILVTDLEGCYTTEMQENINIKKIK